MTFNRSRATRLVVIGATLALTVGAFGGSAVHADNHEDASDVVIELIVKENINPFWVSMIKSFNAKAEELGVGDANACWGERDPDPEGQTACIENALARGATTILIAPANDGVNQAIDTARANGAIVIALDTATDPADVVDITFATDNFQAGLVIGQWARAFLGEEAANEAVIGFINIAPSRPIVGVKRNQGFMQGFGIDVGDITVIGDEDDPRIAGHEDGNGNQEESVQAMELLLQGNPDINVLYTINEPSARGAVQAMETFGLTSDDILIVSVDGGCEAMTDIDDGIINATAQQYPGRMAELGVEWGIRNALTGEIPAATDSEFYIEGNEIFNTGVSLVTNDPIDGLTSIDTTEGSAICWGEF
jgi:fructose transport system substrate-binding protein